MNSRRRSLLRVVMMLLPCWTAGASTLHADPLTFNGTFFAIDSSGAHLDLFSNPGVVLEPSTYGGSIFPAALLFGAFLSFPGGESVTDTIRFTYQEAGAAPTIYSQMFTTGTNAINLGFAVGFEPISRTGKPVATTLTVELLNSAPDFVIPAGPLQGQAVDSYSYSFFTLATVPEPSTVVMVLSGAIPAAFAGGRRLMRRLWSRP